ncbi:MAG: ABC transporter permease [Ignavibacteria bacterium]|nr:ABC transporter permease [Ignavibacteria bacterium]
MRKIFEVAKWEFVEKVKTRAFIISIIITPAIIIGFSMGPTLLSDNESNTTQAIGILDSTGVYFKPLSSELEEYKLDDGQPNYVAVNLYNKHKLFNELKLAGDSLVLSDELEGYLFISEDQHSMKYQFRGRSIGNFKDLKRFERSFNKIRTEIKLSGKGLSSELIKYINDKVELHPIKLEESGKESSANFLVVFFTSFILIMLLMMMILYSGGMLIRSLIEEKSNRLIEILVSSCSSDELLTGKILGLSALGLFQIIIWVVLAIALTGSSLIPADAFKNVAPMLIYFVLGFIFYTSIFVGAGSIASTEQEAQQLTSYISLILLFPIILVFSAVQNSDSFMLQLLSYIPFTTPSIMILRLNLQEVSPQEILITTLILIISIYITITVAAKIFKIGILSYGKRPSVREIFQWLKEK